MKPALRLAPVVATALVLAGCRGSEQGAREPTSVPGAVVIGLADGCPPTGTDVPYPEDRVVPHGAIGVRLCPATEGTVVAGYFRHELTTGVDDLADLVTTLAVEPVPDDFACAGVGTDGPSYTVWFRYPDDHAVAVDYRHDCLSLRFGPDPADATVNGQLVYEALEDGLHQEAGSEPSYVRGLAGCDGVRATFSVSGTAPADDAFGAVSPFVLPGEQVAFSRVTAPGRTLVSVIATDSLPEEVHRVLTVTEHDDGWFVESTTACGGRWTDGAGDDACPPHLVIDGVDHLQSTYTGEPELGISRVVAQATLPACSGIDLGARGRVVLPYDVTPVTAYTVSELEPEDTLIVSLGIAEDDEQPKHVQPEPAYAGLHD